MKLFLKILTIFVIGSFLTACSTTIPAALPAQDTAPTDRSVFTHEKFNDVLAKFVNDKGKVNYTGIKQNPSNLESYYYDLSRFSPDSHPQMFPTKDHELAYWINAYNAAVIKTVLHYYPVQSVKEIESPAWAFFLPKIAGFFVFQRQEYGGVTTNLYTLENSVIRKRYNEPRIHFAINCASGGCPILPMQAFRGEILEQQLEQAATLFFSEERNLSVDKTKKTIYLSSIIAVSYTHLTLPTICSV